MEYSFLRWERICSNFCTTVTTIQTSFFCDLPNKTYHKGLYTNVSKMRNTADVASIADYAYHSRAHEITTAGGRGLVDQYFCSMLCYFYCCLPGNLLCFSHCTACLFSTLKFECSFGNPASIFQKYPDNVCSLVITWCFESWLGISIWIWIFQK